MMSALNSVWQDSHAVLCYYLGCGKEKPLWCLRVVVGSLQLKGGGGLMMTSHLPHPSRLRLAEL